MKQFQKTFSILAALLIFSSAGSLWAQQNPCNKAKNPCNPCGSKMGGIPPIAVNPCHAKMGTVFYVADPMARNSVTFASKAPLEDIVGLTNQIYGYIVFDPNAPMKGGRGELWVPIASMDTGIPLRNEHMLSADWLNAGQHPNIKYSITHTTNVKMVKNTPNFQTYDMTLSGMFSLNGVSKNTNIPARITYMKASNVTAQKMPGNILAGRASFKVPLNDFNVTGPKGMGLVGSKVSSEIEVDLSIFSSDIKPSGAKNPCNPCNPCAKKK